jgi:hypothetical protein
LTKKASIIKKLATKLVLFSLSKYCHKGKNLTIIESENNNNISKRYQILLGGNKKILSAILSKFNSPKVRKIAKKQIKINMEEAELKQKLLNEIFKSFLLYEIVVIAKKAKL